MKINDEEDICNSLSSLENRNIYTRFLFKTLFLLAEKDGRRIGAKT